MKKILLTLLAFAIPLTTFAQIPAFPMAFYGSVTIDGVDAPVDSVVRVYDENEVIGSIAVTQAGQYGSTDPVEARLVVGEFTDGVVFAVQSASINGGVEIVGEPAQTHGSFVAGETTEKHLAFVTIEDDNDDSDTTTGNSRPSRSGGSSPKTNNDDDDEEPEPEAEVLGVTTSSEIALRMQLLSLLTQLVQLLQFKLQLMHGV